MPQAQNDSITLEFDHFGDRSNPALLLIMGFGAQMTAWDEGFCRMLADAGLFVVRFDNRDCGLSSKTAGDPPDLMTLMGAALMGQAIGDVPYTLADMAADAMSVLDALDIEQAHVAGASMGGMITQRVAINHADRVLSMTSIMSTTGDRSVGQADPEAMAALIAPPPAERDAIIEHGVKLTKVISGPLFDEQKARRRAIETYERSFYPQGAPFQMAAILSDGDRTEELNQLDVPALVIHGAADRLITPSGGEATAAAIPGATLLVLDQMGHDLPEPLWPQMIAAMVEVAGI